MGFFSNIAMQLTKLLRMPPVKIADIIINNIKTEINIEGTYIKNVEKV